MQTGSLFLLLALLLIATPATSPILFTDIAKSAGIDFIANSSPTAEKHQPETMVGGVALLDYDGDGYLDIYFVNGASMPGLTKESPQFKNRLYHNNHNLTFTDVTDQAGLAGAGYGMGAAVGDYDNDGRPDIYVVNVNGNQLFHNNGDGTFTDVTAKAGVPGGTHKGHPMWSDGATWVDFNNDGLLDLFVSNYCEWNPATEPPCVVNGHRITCSPRLYQPLPNTLYRNNGNGTFTDVSVQTGIAAHPGRNMGAAIADYDGDGYTDIFVAGDDTPNLLFHNLGGKRFDEVGLDAGVALPESGDPISGMGVDFRDAFNRGLPDIWLTAIEKQTFPLYRNLGKGQFEDGTAMSGLGLQTAGMSGWSNGIIDFDNDGWKDLFVARANVMDNVALFAPRQFEEPNSLFRNLGNGKFQNVSSAAGADFQLAGVHRGAAFGDLDNDGRVDAVVTVLNGAPKIFHNQTQNSNHWLLLQLIGSKSNRLGIGARIRVSTADGMTQYNHATTSIGYASSSDVRVHFGLGAATSAKEIQIQWPSGIRQTLTNVPADQVLAVHEPIS